MITHMPTASTPTMWASVKATIVEQGRVQEIAERYGFRVGKTFTCPHCKKPKGWMRVSNGSGGCNVCRDGFRFSNIIDFVAKATCQDPNYVVQQVSEYLGLGIRSRSVDSYRVVIAPNHDVPQRTLADDGYCLHREKILSSTPITGGLAKIFAHDGCGFDYQSLHDIGAATIKWKPFRGPPHTVTGLPVYGEKMNVCNWVLRPQELTKRIHLGTSEFKSLTAFSSSDKLHCDRRGVLLSQSSWELVRLGKPTPWLSIVRLEGELDLLAALTLLPQDSYLCFTNNWGARDQVRHFDWFLERLSALKPKQWVSVGDCDRAGIESATAWSQAFDHHKTTGCVIRPTLPMPFTETHGKDFRDWVIEGGTIEMFEGMLQEVEI
jgi:hypothetical protein